MLFDECGVCSGDDTTCSTQVSMAVDTATADVCSDTFSLSFAESIAAALGLNASRIRIEGIAYENASSPCAAATRRRYDIRVFSDGDQIPRCALSLRLAI
jgi:hypothetical protein